jgi:hypothetical protein
MKAPEVGGEVEAYCTKCKADTGHVIVALSGQEVKRVECLSCGGQHNYRKPKSAAAPPKTKKKASGEKKSGERKSKASAQAAVLIDEASWVASLKVGSGAVRDYRQDQAFENGEVITHATFGMGRVEDVLRNKMKVAFRAGAKLLICKDKRA